MRNYLLLTPGPLGTCSGAAAACFKMQLVGSRVILIIVT